VGHNRHQRVGHARFGAFECTKGRRATYRKMGRKEKGRNLGRERGISKQQQVKVEKKRTQRIKWQFRVALGIQRDEFRKTDLKHARNRAAHKVGEFRFSGLKAWTIPSAKLVDGSLGVTEEGRRYDRSERVESEKLGQGEKRSQEGAYRKIRRAAMPQDGQKRRPGGGGYAKTHLIEKEEKSAVAGT